MAWRWFWRNKSSPVSINPGPPVVEPPRTTGDATTPPEVSGWKATDRASRYVPEFRRLCAAWYETFDEAGNEYWVFGDCPPQIGSPAAWFWAPAVDVRLNHDVLSWPNPPDSCGRFSSLKAAREDFCSHPRASRRSHINFEREESALPEAQALLSTIRENVAVCSTPEAASDILYSLDTDLEHIIPDALDDQKERLHLWRMHIRGCNRGIRRFASENLQYYGHLTDSHIKRICQSDVISTWLYWRDRGELPITPEVRRGVGFWSESKSDLEVRAVVSRNWRRFYESADEDGQPVNQQLNAERRRVRSVDECIGIIRGIMADDRVQEEEVHTLAKWLLASGELIDEWPISIIAERLNRVYADHVVDDQEREDLRELFRELMGSHEDVSEFRNAATKLPLTKPPPNIVVPDRLFVFTGKFLHGTRKSCEQAVLDRGGFTKRQVTEKVDYLVIGAIGSRDWIHSTHGRKIEAAVANVERGHPTAIISEEHWERFL